MDLWVAVTKLPLYEAAEELCRPLAFRALAGARGATDAFLRWLTHTHTMRWHAHYHTSGTGHLYQGRFKAFPIEADDHLYAVLRYVERNALRANLVKHAQQWRWSSLWRRVHGDEAAKAILAMADP